MLIASMICFVGWPIVVPSTRKIQTAVKVKVGIAIYIVGS